MNVREITARTILTKTGIYGLDYCLNPYVGCAHGCRYCYATFMKKYSGHTEEWGEFVDAKINAPELLKRELRRGRSGEVILSSVTDPYQPIEAAYRTTRACLEILALSDLKVCLLTKSMLVVRDTDILSRIKGVDVGLTVATDREDMREIFEPAASSIAERVEALKALKQAGIATHAFIGPILPMNPERLVETLAPHINRVLIDRMNYPWKVREVYRRHGLAHTLEPAYFEEVEETLLRRFSELGVRIEAA
jgi:DNA repair photolyase